MPITPSPEERLNPPVLLLTPRSEHILEIARKDAKAIFTHKGSFIEAKIYNAEGNLISEIPNQAWQNSSHDFFDYQDLIEAEFELYIHVSPTTPSLPVGYRIDDYESGFYIPLDPFMEIPSNLDVFHGDYLVLFANPSLSGDLSRMMEDYSHTTIFLMPGFSSEVITNITSHAEKVHTEIIVLETNMTKEF